MFELLGICVALAALLAINALVSVVTSILWRLIRAHAEKWPAAACSQIIFALRVIPLLTAIAVVAFLLFPAYIIYEPRYTAEKVSFKLATLAIFSTAGLTLAVWRGYSAWLATRRLVDNWLQNASPVKIDRISIPVYRLRHHFPIIAVIGFFHKRLFIADQLFDSLSREELAAAIAHECGHLAARDNLKRALLRVCRDVLMIFPCGRSLDRAWAETSEVAADEYAARLGGESALNLASALVKIARLIPSGVKPATPLNASLIFDNPGAVARRIDRLIHMASSEDVRERESVIENPSIWIWLGAILTVLSLAVLSPHLLSNVHGLIEIAVSLLQ